MKKDLFYRGASLYAIDDGSKLQDWCDKANGRVVSEREWESLYGADEARGVDGVISYKNNVRHLRETLTVEDVERIARLPRRERGHEVWRVFQERHNGAQEMRKTA